MSLADIKQRSDAWIKIRLGLVTASRVYEVLARQKNGKPYAARANYAAELIAERLSGEPAMSFVSAAMQWGIDRESDARAAYEFYRDVTVAEVGFVRHSMLAAGASPDGLVGNDGLIEIKCPNTATHIETLRTGAIDPAYLDQMQWQMACTGRQWCDFISFDPRMPESMAMWVRRHPRDDARIAEMEAEVTAFLSEIEAAIADLCRLYEPAIQSEAA